ncbi:T9SS type A sorting domain-containing protein [bacterium]|nr:T9SS type A sorting domain-containing protein [bacterium]
MRINSQNRLDILVLISVFAVLFLWLPVQSVQLDDLADDAMFPSHNAFGIEDAMNAPPLQREFLNELDNDHEAENVDMLARLYHFWDRTFDVHIADGIAYLANRYSGVTMLDISDPENIFEVGTYDSPGGVPNMTVQGDILFVVDWYAGLRIVDISDMSNPVELSYWDDGHVLEYVSIQGSYAYVSAGAEGLFVVDISNLAEPVLVAEESSWVSWDSCIRDNFLFLGSGIGGLRIIDISDPVNFQQIGHYDSNGYCYSVDIFGNYAYMTDGSVGFKVIDISDLSSPTFVSGFDTEYYCSDVCYSEGFIFLCDSYDGFDIYNVTDPENPVEVADIPMPTQINAVAVENGLLFLPSNYDHLNIYSVADPENPLFFQRVYTPMLREIEVDDPIAYFAAGYGGLITVDISDPTNPVELARLGNESSLYGCDLDTDNQLFIGAAQDDGIWIIDVSNPVVPVSLSELNLNATTNSVSHSGDYLFCSTSEGVIVVDYSDPLNPVEEYTFSDGMTIRRVILHGAYAFICGDAAGLFIYDISNPLDAQLVGSYDTPGNLYDLAIYNDIAYLADNTDFLMLSIEDYTNPLLIDLIDPPEGVFVYTYGVSVANGFLYASQWTAGVFIYDLIDPLNPTQAGYYDTPGAAWKTFVNDDLVLVSDLSNAGMYNFSALTGMTIPLQGNYFELVSTPFVPPSNSAEDVFGDIGGLQIVYNDVGEIYFPGDEINTIGDIDFADAYYVFTGENSEWILTGPPVEGELDFVEYDLTTNQWHWVSLPTTYDFPVDGFFSDIADLVRIVLTDDGRMWVPNHPLGEINTMGDMHPGEGFKIFVDEDVIFTFGTQMGRLATSSDVWQLPEVLDAPPATGKPYAILVQGTDQLISLHPALIEVYDGDVLVGKATWLDEYGITPVTAWQGSSEHNLPGYIPQNEISIRVLDSDGQIIGINNASSADQIPRFDQGAYAEIMADAIVQASSLPEAFVIGEAYPNPFNSTVTIPFGIPERMAVDIRLYNVLGQLKYEFNSDFRAGYHNFTLMGEEFVSGMYFVEVTADNQSFLKKIILLK